MLCLRNEAASAHPAKLEPRIVQYLEVSAA